MLGISDAAESIGFRTRGVRISLEQLIEDVPLPCILHWNQDHFVVLYGIKRKELETFSKSPIRLRESMKWIRSDSRNAGSVPRKTEKIPVQLWH